MPKAFLIRKRPTPARHSLRSRNIWNAPSERQTDDEDGGCKDHRALLIENKRNTERPYQVESKFFEDKYLINPESDITIRRSGEPPSMPVVLPMTNRPSGLQTIGSRRVRKEGKLNRKRNKNSDETAGPEMDEASARSCLPQSEITCQLCKQTFLNALSLAEHRCSEIQVVYYKCPECSKVFNCPANLASHRRWHRPITPSRGAASKPSGEDPVVVTPTGSTDTTATTSATDNHGSAKENVSRSVERIYESSNKCSICGKVFRRISYLRKHFKTHEKPPIIVPTRATARPSSRSSFTTPSPRSDSSLHEADLKTATSIPQRQQVVPNYESPLWEKYPFEMSELAWRTQFPVPFYRPPSRYFQLPSYSRLEK